MNLVNYCLKNNKVMLALICMLSLGGVLAYLGLGRLEDPEFTIKEAVITTQYPGATAKEVEQEVTEILESAVQQLKQLHEVRSISRSGLSIITAEIKDSYDKDTLPQVWDELRRKIAAAEAELPPGASSPNINDDFGDVFGIFLALTGDGYSQRELQKTAEDLRRELLMSDGVGKIDFWGFQQEVVYVEFDRSKLATLGISPAVLFNSISQQNTVTDAGRVKVGAEHVRLRISGDFSSIQDLGNQLIKAGEQGGMIRLSDVATISKGYLDPPDQILRQNGKPSVGIGISVVDGGNVVSMGDNVKERLKQLEARIPVGMELHRIAFQADTVSEAVSGFIINLLEAVVIVVVLLVIFMGLREGLIIGGVLLVTILATFIGMQLIEVNLQRISLGALIIALGMLVDNAIVVIEGYIIKIQTGRNTTDAAQEAVGETQWPLLGATIIAILAFAAISLSQDVTGEFLGSLFKVIAIALGLSWVLAITIVPYLCVTFIPANPAAAETVLYNNGFYRGYRRFLHSCIRHRWLTILIVIASLGAAFYSFGFVKQNFFPGSTRPQFMVDLTYPEGTHIAYTDKELTRASEFLSQMDGVTDVTTFAGSGALRFVLTYSPEMVNSAYGQILVTVDDYHRIDEMVPRIREYLSSNHQGAITKVDRFRLGPGGKAVEARFSGPDPMVLRHLADETRKVMWNNMHASAVISDWGNQVKAASISMAVNRAQDIGIYRPEIARATAFVFSGYTPGQYREGEDLLPIIARPLKEQREGIDNLESVMVWSDNANTYVPLEQVANDVTPIWEDPVIRRLNRERTITISSEPLSGTADSLFRELRGPIEAIPLPEGYKLEWGGEYENSNKANTKLMAKVPLAFAVMFFILVMLFNSMRHPMIVFLGLPMALIGVVFGLLVFDMPFGFMALLGFLSLCGMLMKNEIVLLDQINIELAKGTAPLEAVIESAVSRVRPVAMAAFTTVFGMAPLLWDAFFGAMAVTIMAGLTFATILTLIVVPVLYCTFWRVREETVEQIQEGDPVGI